MILKNKNAIIYGAGGSIGGAVAGALAGAGARVFPVRTSISRAVDICRSSAPCIIRRAPSSGTTRLPGVYAREADRRGVEIHQKTAVTGIDVRDGQVVGVQTNRGPIKTKKVLSAVAGYTPRITKMVGLRTPLVVQPLQACVSEPLKPWLDSIVVSASLHIYVSQSSRGELVMGASLDPYELHSSVRRSTSSKGCRITCSICSPSCRTSRSTGNGVACRT